MRSAIEVSPMVLGVLIGLSLHAIHQLVRSMLSAWKDRAARRRAGMPPRERGIADAWAAAYAGEPRPGSMPSAIRPGRPHPGQWLEEHRASLEALVDSRVAERIEALRLDMLRSKRRGGEWAA